MLPRPVRVAAFFLGVSVIAVSTGSFAQDRGRPGAGLRQQPAQQHHLPRWPAQRHLRPWRARDGVPCGSRATTPSNDPAWAPRIAAPPRPAAPRVAGPRPEIQRAAPPQRPAMTRHPEPRIAAPSRPSTSPPGAARPSRKEQIETRAQQREQRVQQRQQMVQERQRNMLSRQTHAAEPHRSLTTARAAIAVAKAGRSPGATRAGTIAADTEPSSPARTTPAARRSGTPAAAGTAAVG